MTDKKERNSKPLNAKYDVITIGAGPAGLIGAIESHSEGKSIMIIEQMKRPALKLRITGGGSCNITNNCDLESFISGYGKNGKFLREAFNQFFSTELIKYFNNLGVEFELERGGRYYPKSGRADSIVNALLDKVKELNIPILTDTRVITLKKIKNSGYEVLLSDKRSVLPERDRFLLEADKILIATGGRSYPLTGSDGSGYKLAESLGHKIILPIPALVPLKGKGKIPEALNGLNIKNCRVTLLSGEKKVDERFGEMEFRDNEIAGPVILSMSEMVVRRVKRGEKVSILIDLKPSLEHRKLNDRILRETEDRSNKTFSDILKKLLPKKAVELFLELTGIKSEKRPDQITREERKILIDLLKGLHISLKGSVSIDKALVTAGGVSIREIEPGTMKSMIADGIYFAGEIIDLNGETGGYNLQAAFSTGWLAGRSIRESLKQTGE